MCCNKLSDDIKEKVIEKCFVMGKRKGVWRGKTFVAAGLGAF